MLASASIEVSSPTESFDQCLLDVVGELPTVASQVDEVGKVRRIENRLRGSIAELHVHQVERDQVREVGRRGERHHAGMAGWIVGKVEKLQIL